MSAKPTPPFGQDIVKQCIPHRDPMLMITKVTALSEGAIDIENHVADDAPFFAGHFPGNPIETKRYVMCACQNSQAAWSAL